ncbi:MAG: DUF2283 domain-containing protein [Dehalococcoidia bacterium]|nr:DUF2283 domain-containing protein [Dehalococcoidia bacterium]
MTLNDSCLPARWPSPPALATASRLRRPLPEGKGLQRGVPFVARQGGAPPWTLRSMGGLTIDNQRFAYDEEADAIYVYLRELSVTRTERLDDIRLIDYSDDGAVVGIEFLSVSEGIDLADIPFARTVEKLLGNSGYRFRIFAR